MNTRTAYNTNPKCSIETAAFPIDEKLAFVERVCALLMESRFGPAANYSRLSESSGRSERPLNFELGDWVPFRVFVSRPNMIDLDAEIFVSQSVFVDAKTARPTAPADQSSLPANAKQRMGVQGVEDISLRSQVAAANHARGSPSHSTSAP